MYWVCHANGQGSCFTAEESRSLCQKGRNDGEGVPGGRRRDATNMADLSAAMFEQKSRQNTVICGMGIGFFRKIRAVDFMVRVIVSENFKRRMSICCK